MTRRTVTFVVLAAVVLAGCQGGPIADPTETDSVDDSNQPAIESPNIPGVTNQALTNVTALGAANERMLAKKGGAIRSDRPGDFGGSSYELTIGAVGRTYSISGVRQLDNGGSLAVDIWGNQTTRVSRRTRGGATTYRTTERRTEQHYLTEEVTRYLEVGEFTVANETTGNGTVVLTADEYTSSSDGPGQLGTVTSFNGRLVVDESGLIHNLSVQLSDGEGTVTYQYELLRTGIDQIEKPDWVASVPASASLEPHLATNIQNSSSLVVRNEGGDHVPANTTLNLTTNGTTHTARFATALEPGDRRYAFVDASTGSLAITDTKPTAENVDSVSSPVSITVTTADGVTLYSGGMAWASESAGTAGKATSVSGGSSTEAAG